MSDQWYYQKPMITDEQWADNEKSDGTNKIEALERNPGRWLVLEYNTTIFDAAKRQQKLIESGYSTVTRSTVRSKKLINFRVDLLVMKPSGDPEKDQQLDKNGRVIGGMIGGIE